MEHTDIELIIAYRGGDTQALDTLILRYVTLVYNFVFRLVHHSAEAQDITQEVFVKMWKKLSQYNMQYNFKAWLFTIARNTTIDHMRKQKTFSFSDFDKEDTSDFEDSLVDTSPRPDEILFQKDQAEQIAIAMEKLSVQHKTVLVLKHESELTFEEIATVLRIPMNTAKGQYYRALQALKKNLSLS